MGAGKWLEGHDGPNARLVASVRKLMPLSMESQQATWLGPGDDL